MPEILSKIIRTQYLILLAFFMLYTSVGSAQPAYFNQLDLLNGKKKAIVPFKYIHNFIVIEARIYGIIPLQFIFDTGAENIILFKREYTDLMQVTYDKRIPVLGSDMSREIYALIARNGVIEVNGLAPKPADMLVLEEDYFNLDEMIGTPVAGLIGGGFFRNLIIHVDYRKKQIILYDPAYFKIPEDFISLPLRIKTNRPYINAQASLADGTVVQVDLLVDTGAGVPLLLHNNSHPSLHLPEQYIKGKLGMGLGGYLEGYIGRIQKLSVGSFDFPQVLTSFQNVEEAWLQDPDKFRNGIVGNELLDRFDIYFDYIHGQMLLKANRSKQIPFTMDRSGLVLFAYGREFNQYVVRDVLENSPARQADIRVDDVITRIGGTSARYFTLDAINQLLQKKAGKKVRLSLLRGKETLRKEIILRDLI
jgi:predicted aspartyl protease